MPVLLAIPLFTFAGYLLGESRAPERLVRLTTSLLGWLPGGLAVVALSQVTAGTNAAIPLAGSAHRGRPDRGMDRLGMDDGWRVDRTL